MGQIEQWQAQLRDTASMSMMEAQYHVTTPMFIGDGEQKARDVRPPSIKGALRFWWRALNWGTILKQQQQRVNAALQALHAQEATLFGLAARDNQGGQGLFTLKVTQAPIPANPVWQPGQGTQYLLGQGLWHFRDKLLRPFIPAGHLFSVTVTARGLMSKTHEHQALWHSLEDALLALGMWGGLGSRARRGLGSVSIHALRGGQHSAPTTLEDYSAHARRLLEYRADGADLPPFSALSQQSRLSLSGIQQQNANRLLEQLGSEMQLYRSWGNEGYVGKLKAERHFTEDHDTVIKAAQGDRLHTPPQRMVFGLPHNYFFSSLKKGNKIVEINVKKDAAGERRASPLLMHVHQFPSGQCLACQLLLPAVFLPGRHPQLQYKHGRTSYLDCPETQIQWQVIHDFMDRFKDWHTLGSTAYRKPSGAA